MVRGIGKIYELPAPLPPRPHGRRPGATRWRQRRLIHDRQADGAVAEVQQILLWNTALHIEEGELAVAERDLRNACSRLCLDALANDAPMTPRCWSDLHG